MCWGVCVCSEGQRRAWGRNREEENEKQDKQDGMGCVTQRGSKQGLLLRGTESQVEAEMIFAIKNIVELKGIHHACHFKTQVKKVKK